jgi:hypothetical protein
LRISIEIPGSFQINTWVLEHDRRPRKLDLELGDELAADVVRDTRERLVADIGRDGLRNVHQVLL